MKTQQLAEGLWRWTAPHPGWTSERGGPGGWERMVGCVYHEAPDAVVLIDPLAPPVGTDDAGRFWSALDEDVARCGRPVAVVVSNAYHGRDAAEVHRRYRDRPGATLHVPAQAAARLACEATHRFEDGATLPGGVTAHAIEGLDVGETALFLAGPRALVVADAVIGSGPGAVQVAPASWAADGQPARDAYHARFRASLRRLVDLCPALLLPSHGEPVLQDAGPALARALEAPPWGSEPG